MPAAILLGALLPALAWAQAAAEPEASATAPVDARTNVDHPPAESPPESPTETPPKTRDEQQRELAEQVRRVFQLHCIKCHNAQMRAGGLALESEEQLRQGGHSGRAVLGGPLADNELYARISSSDRTYRMPKDSAPLPEEDVATIRRWIDEGSPWFANTPQKRKLSTWESAVETVGGWIDRYEYEYSYALPYTIAFLVLQVLLLIVLRTRTACRKRPDWNTGRGAAFRRLCMAVHPRELVLVLLLAAGGVALAFARGHVLKLEDEVDKLASRVVVTTSGWSQTVYGHPPKPVRPNHDKGVTRTYYRGNCERNPALFNNGNYLTAIFRVSLCDEHHRPLEIGEPLPEGGLFLRCEIERAPGTTDSLFSNDMMSSVLLTRRFYESPDNKLEEIPVRMETLQEGWRWVGYVPLEEPEEQAIDGVVYLYTGRIDDKDRLNGNISYGIEYHLKVADGKLADGSDLWMDSFGNGAFAPPVPPDKLPYSEWFDYRPMPVIAGENSTDPALLGTDEYVRKGLIKPPAEPAESQAAESADAEASDRAKDAPDGK